MHVQLAENWFWFELLVLRCFQSLRPRPAPLTMSSHTVYAEDMTDVMMNKAITVGKAAFAMMPAQVGATPEPRNTTCAREIRASFDKEFTGCWHCVVGRRFGAYVTHEIKTYIYFSVVPGVSVLLWKT